MALQSRLRSALTLLRAATAAAPLQCRQFCRKSSTTPEKVEALVKDITESLKDPDSKVAVEKALKIVESLSVVLKDARSQASILKGIEDIAIVHRVSSLEAAHAYSSRASNWTSSVYWGFLLLTLSQLHQLDSDAKIGYYKLDTRMSALEKEGSSKDTSNEEAPSEDSAPKEVSLLCWAWGEVKKVFGC